MSDIFDKDFIPSIFLAFLLKNNFSTYSSKVSYLLEDVKKCLSSGVFEFYNFQGCKNCCSLPPVIASSILRCNRLCIVAWNSKYDDVDDFIVYKYYFSFTIIINIHVKQLKSIACTKNILYWYFEIESSINWVVSIKNLMEWSFLFVLVFLVIYFILLIFKMILGLSLQNIYIIWKN